MVDLCIYHANCMDGFTSAWAVKKRHPDVMLKAASYNDPAPYVEGLDVAIVDFSYPYEVMADMAEVADSILVLDHHASAYEAVRKLNENFDNVEVEFDLERSGAGITWEWFHGKSTHIPLLVECVQDRDLWKFEVAGTKQLHAYLTSLPYNMQDWDNVHHELETKGSLASLFLAGGAIMRAATVQIKSLIKTSSYRSYAFGHYVPFLNCPYVWASEAGNLMSAEESVPFSVSYVMLEKGVKVSLRSSKEGLDVQALAGQFGGGGHKNAAGFWLERLQETFISKGETDDKGRLAHLHL